MHTSAWSIVKDGSQKVIRRWVYFQDGSKKFERYPKKKYKHIIGSSDLENFVIRLNGRDPRVEAIKEKLKIRNAYLSDEVLEDYRINYLFHEVPTKKDAQTLFGYLYKYALSFFIQKLEKADPIEWHKSQNLWGRYLLNKGELETNKRIFQDGEIKSSKLIRNTINELNRFMRYLHLKFPEEIPSLVFQPITKSAFKEHEARRKLKKNIHVSKYIKPEHWELIVKYLEKHNISCRFQLYLAKAYGLRRAETMGVVKEDIRKSCLYIQRQIDCIKDGEIVYKPLKNRLPRKIPHWMVTPSQAYAWVNSMSPCHPDTITSKFKEIVQKLELPNYVVHDIRRTFITDSIKKGIEPEELRLAVGHSNIQTTYKFYVMDSRSLEDDIFIPEEGEL